MSYRAPSVCTMRSLTAHLNGVEGRCVSLNTQMMLSRSDSNYIGSNPLARQTEVFIESTRCVTMRASVGA